MKTTSSPLSSPTEHLLLDFIIPSLHRILLQRLTDRQIFPIWTAAVFEDTLATVRRCVVLQGLAPFQGRDAVSLAELIVPVDRCVLEGLRVEWWGDLVFGLVLVVDEDSVGGYICEMGSS